MNPDFRPANYHTHTTRCMHASGREEEYVLRAIDVGFSAIGFADHSPWPYKSSFVADMRMHLRQLDGYVQTVKRLKEKYADQIRVHLALECEAFPEFYPWLQEIRDEKGLEYIILGNHYDTNDELGGDYFGRCNRPEHIRRYLETTVAGMESGLFVYLAHPDLFLNSYPVFDDTARHACREICRTAKALNMPLEYNLLGLKRRSGAEKRGFVGYTSREFWEIAAETGNRAIIGVDAHNPDHLDCRDLYLQAYAYLENLEIPVLNRLEEIE